MKERPILFSGPMVRAILEGRKTQTRRVVMPQPSEDWCPEVGIYVPTMVDRHGEEYPGPEVFGASDESEGRVCHYGEPGDHLWVKETWQAREIECTGIDGYAYAADGAFLPIKPTREAADNWVIANDNGKHGRNWRPSIFCFRWVSRILLDVAEIRVQRLQSISEEDAKAEGVEPFVTVGTEREKEWYPEGYRANYKLLWDKLNKKRGFGWDINPWVWSITFKRVQP
jgi:hypothetical protein